MQQHYESGTVCYCSCGSVVKPDIVFYKECVNEEYLTELSEEAKTCDLLLVLGTSLSTYPVSECIQLFNDCDLVFVSPSSYVDGD